MRSSQEAHQETVELVADAVSELTRRALRPELQPFGKELSQASARLRTQVDRIAEPLSDLAGQVDRLGGRLAAVERTVVAELHRAHADQRSGTETVVAELRSQLDATRRTLRAARMSLLLLVVVLVVVLGLVLGVVLGVVEPVVLRG